jgi:glycosyltransferase involved in cell wall biosynthesis
MKLAMVNDCAYVGETILKYLPENIEKTHIKRSRGLWSKTFGIAYKIWRAKADVYHVHYLLQDCYLASLFGKKPLIGHAHGSDLKTTINRFDLGRMVRSNLKKCDRILVSTPDLIEIARQYRKEAEYLPNPVDTELFHKKPLSRNREKLKVLIAGGSNWAVKGTNIAIQAMTELKEQVDVFIIAYGKDLEKTLALAKSLGLEMQVLPVVPHEKLNEYFWSADLVMDQFQAGVFGLISLEAIACGRPVVTYISSKYPEHENLLLKDIDSSEKIIEAIKNMNNLTRILENQYSYFKENHNAKTVAAKMLRIYEELQGA